MIALIDDLAQSSGLLYGPLVAPVPRRSRRAKSPGGAPLTMSRSPRELLELGLQTIRSQGMRSAHLTGNLEQKVERFLGGDRASTCLLAPLGVAIALSVPERDHSWVSTFKGSYAFRYCLACASDMDEEEVHILDMGIKEGHNRICMNCIKAEGEITEPIEQDPDVALSWIECRLTGLGHLPG